MNILIVGASHGIGRELAFKYHQEGHALVLAARDLEALQEIKSELKNNIEIFALDATNQQNAQEIISNISKIDLFIYCAATYKPMPSWQIDLPLAKQIIDINLIGALNCIDAVIKKMLPQKSGQIALIASVAGYAGLPQSFAYGASKAALINLAQTMRAELSCFNIKVSVINPGFVKTRLTDKNDFKMPFLISTKQAADYIFKGLEKNKFEIHFPKRFTFLLKLLQMLPYNIFFFLTKKIAQKNLSS